MLTGVQLDTHTVLELSKWWYINIWTIICLCIYVMMIVFIFLCNADTTNVHLVPWNRPLLSNAYWCTHICTYIHNTMDSIDLYIHISVLCIYVIVMYLILCIADIPKFNSLPWNRPLLSNAYWYTHICIYIHTTMESIDLCSHISMYICN